MKKITTTLLASILVIALPLAAGDDTRWLNVHVTEAEDGANIQVHLPMQLILAVINSVDVENFHSGMVDLELSDADIDWPQLLAAVKEAPDGEFVTVDAEDAHVRVSKSAGTLYVDVVETGDENANVKVTLPMSIIDGLQINEDNQFDVAALLSAFDQLPSGDLVTVDADDATVRVWVE
jgi:hypothetical protein